MEQKIRSGLKTREYKIFADAIEKYIDGGNDDRFLARPAEFLGLIKLSEINQEAINNAAREAFPPYQRGKKGVFRLHKKSTIKRQFYVPVAAVLHHVHDLGWIPYIRVKMPKVDRPAPQWADEEWFEKFNEVASADLKVLVMFLASTGSRISEALNLLTKDTNFKKQECYTRTSKNGDPRMVHLPDYVVDALKTIHDPDKERVFYMYKDRFQVNRQLRVICAKAGIEYLSSHKVGSHTFATNLARLEKMDAKALTETGRWKDPKSTHHYTHFLKREQSAKADSLRVLFKK